MSAYGAINHIVVLMMENRSFDHLFGDFPGVDRGIAEAQSNYLDPESPTSPEYAPYPIDVNSQPNYNPGHFFRPMMQNFFGKDAAGYTGKPINKYGQPISLDTNTPPTMCGFVYSNQYVESDDPQHAPVMSYFKYLKPGNSGRLNVLHTLAENYVLCENWFCDTPSSTVPNRHFMHLATNLGYNDTDPSAYQGPGNPEEGEAGALFEQTTIFEWLDNNMGSQGNYGPQSSFSATPNPYQSNWAMYGFPWDEYDSAMYSYTSPSFDYDSNNAPPTEYINANRSIFDFPIDVLTGNLPFYTFIMPSLLFGSRWACGNSMHPDGDIRLGENFIASVYNVLRNSPIWNQTLLIVTFDESGGFYDHVMPPTTTTPDGNTYPRGSATVMFDYTLLGPRIPALLVSPWLKNTICKDQLQNTSILRTVENLVFDMPYVHSPLSSESFMPDGLTGRDKGAPPIDMADIWIGTDTPREDCPLSIDLYAGFPAWGTTLIDPHGDSFESMIGGEVGTGPFIPPNPPTGQGEIGVAKISKCGQGSSGGPGSTVAEGLAASAVKTTEDSATAGIGVSEDAPAYDFAKEYAACYPGHPDSGKILTRQFGSLRELRDYMTERREAARHYYHANKTTQQPGRS